MDSTLNLIFFVALPLFVLGQIVLMILLSKAYNLKARQQRAEKDADIARQEAILAALQARS